jgi:transposase
MKIIGCDFHPSFQQIAMLDLGTGELTKKKLLHASGEAAEFYRSLQGEPVRVGIEATGSTRWLERLLDELGQELVMGDAAKIRASCVRRQKTDARDADQLLVARKLAVRLYWMLKTQQPYPPAPVSSSPSHSVSAA